MNSTASVENHAPSRLRLARRELDAVAVEWGAPTASEIEQAAIADGWGAPTASDDAWLEERNGITRAVKESQTASEAVRIEYAAARAALQRPSGLSRPMTDYDQGEWDRKIREATEHDQRVEAVAQKAKELDQARTELDALQRAASLLEAGQGDEAAKLALVVELLDKGLDGAQDVARRAVERAVDARHAKVGTDQLNSGRPPAWSQMYWQTRRWYSSDKCTLTLTDRAILGVLVDFYSAETKEARPGLATVARRAGCTIPTARKAVTRLQGKGVITAKSNGERRPKSYSFHVPTP